MVLYSKTYNIGVEAMRFDFKKGSGLLNLLTQQTLDKAKDALPDSGGRSWSIHTVDTDSEIDTCRITVIRSLVSNAK